MNDKTGVPLSMAVDEVCAMYRAAANKSKQLKILADMNPGCSCADIAHVLETNGLEVPKPYGRGIGRTNQGTEEKPATQPEPSAAEAADPAPVDDIQKSATKISALERAVKDHSDTLQAISRELKRLSDGHHANVSTVTNRFRNLEATITAHGSTIEHVQSDVNAIREHVSGIEDMLLPSVSDCPFCGGKSEVDSCWIRTVNERIDSYFVVCRSCGARSADYSTKREAIERWNPRTG